MAITVDHIADVSFANHFLQGEAAVAGLRPLEIVTHVDDKPVADVKALREAIKGKTEFNLSVRRLAATRIVRVKMQDAGNSDDK